MNVTIRKIGNSEGVIIPKEVLDRLGLKAGDQSRGVGYSHRLPFAVATAAPSLEQGFGR